MGDQYFTLHSFTQGAVSESNLLGRFAIGYGITVVAGLATWPMDVMRRRAMLRVGNGKRRGGTAWAMGREVVRTEGIQALWEGAGMNILKGIGKAVMTVLWDAITRPDEPPGMEEQEDDFLRDVDDAPGMNAPAPKKN